MGRRDKLVSSDHTTNYKSVVDVDSPEESQRNVPLCGSFRLGVGVSCMSLMTFITFFQESMTTAIVVMSPAGSDSPSSWNVSVIEDGTNLTSNTSYGRESHQRAIRWDKTTESWVVSSFFVGYFVIQLPSGYFVARWGPKTVGLSGLLVSSLLQILTVPAACYLHVPWLLAIRFLAGLGSGLSYGSAFDLMAKWAPLHETSILFGLLGAGFDLGPPLCFVLSLITNKLCPDEGWRGIFYIPGGIGLVMFVAFSIILSDSPLTNRFVSTSEANFIGKTRAPHRACKIPVSSILSSTVVWAALMSQLGSDWMANVVMTQFPLYYEQVTGLSHMQVNILGSGPLFLVAVFIILSGSIADRAISKRILTRTMTRKLFDGAAKVLSIAVCVGLCFLPRESFGLAFFLNVITAAALGLTGGAGFVPNQGEIGPAYTAFICGFCQTGAMWVGFVVPLLFGHLTPHNEDKEWRTGFLITAGIQIVVIFFFTTFASGEIQRWAMDNDARENDSNYNKKKENDF